MNKVIMVGNLTKDPEHSITVSGISVCKFSIAVKRNYVKDGETDADFFNVTTWRGLADNCGKFLAKGKKVAVSGSLQNRSYEGKDGVKKTVTEIQADDVEFLSPKGEGEPSAPKKPVSELVPVDDSELPF